MTLQDAIRLMQDRLTNAGVDNPVLDTRLLVAHALGCERADLIVDAGGLLSENEQQAIEGLIARREKREPVARILGQREFWGLLFGLNEATLEPRPDSETLIEAALDISKCNGAPQSILDLGTGTGCLLLSLLHEWPHAHGVGIDQSPRAAQQAIANAQNLGLHERSTFLVGDWFAPVKGRFDMIVSNPPYIPSQDIAFLQPEVQVFDPMAALDGGSDGLDPYRILIPQLALHLNPKGCVLFEVGAGQAQEVSRLLKHHDFEMVQAHKDLGDIARIISGQLRP